jgi:hypothetical protein
VLKLDCVSDHLAPHKGRRRATMHMPLNFGNRDLSYSMLSRCSLWAASSITGQANDNLLTYAYDSFLLPLPRYNFRHHNHQGSEPPCRHPHLDEDRHQDRPKTRYCCADCSCFTAGKCSMRS